MNIIFIIEANILLCECHGYYGYDVFTSSLPIYNVTILHNIYTVLHNVILFFIMLFLMYILFLISNVGIFIILFFLMLVVFLPHRAWLAGRARH